MKLEGIHHITGITGDAPRNVEFYAGTLGLRLVKKSVNQDDPTVYHLFYADEKGSAGSDITFFEYPDVPKGRAGAGMVYRVVWRVATEEALGFWQSRLSSKGVESEKTPGSLRFRDPEGLELQFVLDQSDEAPLMADHPEVPAEFSLRGFAGVRAFDSEPARSSNLLGETLGFSHKSDREWISGGDARSSFYVYDEPPAKPGLSGGGTIHHVAWACQMDEHDSWRARVAEVANVTPVIDRYYFQSIYFREPSGILFEIATLGPGFAVDEPLESLGERLALPPDYEHLRDKLEGVLTPLPNPR